MTKAMEDTILLNKIGANYSYIFIFKAVYIKIDKTNNDPDTQHLTTLSTAHSSTQPRTNSSNTGDKSTTNLSRKVTNGRQYKPIPTRITDFTRRNTFIVILISVEIDNNEGSTYYEAVCTKWKCISELFNTYSSSH